MTLPDVFAVNVLVQRRVISLGTEKGVMPDDLVIDQFY